MLRLVIWSGISGFFLVTASFAEFDTGLKSGGIDLIITADDQILTVSEVHDLICSEGNARTRVWRAVLEFLSTKDVGDRRNGYFVTVNGRGEELEQKAVEDSFDPEHECSPGLAKSHTLCKSLAQSICVEDKMDDDGDSGALDMEEGAIAYHRSGEKVNLNSDNTLLLDVMPDDFGGWDITLEFSPAVADHLTQATRNRSGDWIAMGIEGQIISTARITGVMGGPYLFMGLEKEEDVQSITKALSDQVTSAH